MTRLLHCKGSSAGQQDPGLEMQSMPHANEDSAADAPLIGANDDIHPDDNAPASTIRASGNAFLWGLTLSACVSGLLFGFDTGVISGTLVSIGADLSSRELTTLDKGLITSCTSLFALIASPIAGVLADRWGRKKIILLADALFTLGALWQAATGSVWGMILGRSIVGLAIGGASLIVPLYLSELAPGHLRGRLVTVLLLFITGGQVIAYIIGWAFSAKASGWRWMVGLGAVPAVAQLFMLIFMPETPRYLAKTEREADARAVLSKVYHGMTVNTTGVVNKTMRAIKKEILDEEEARVGVKSTSDSSILPPTLQSLLFYAPHARALAITCSLQALQQLCGFNTLMYFSATIFKLLEFDSPTLTSLSVAGTNFVFTVAAFHLIDRAGRRKILLATIPLMTIALLICAGSFGFVNVPSNDHDQNEAPTSGSNAEEPPRVLSRGPAIGVLLSILLYVSTYATGLGVVPWQQSELFPLSVRSLGSSFATATNWGCNTIVGLTFLPMMDLLTPQWTFVCYAVICAAGWCVIWTIYPETMGLALEDVGDLLKDGWGVKESTDRLKSKRTENP